MRQLFKRLGCFAAVIVWLGFMACPILVCVLVSNGQIEWGDNPQNQMRLFMMQEPDKEGLGFQWTRPANDDATCTYTTVRYPIMFEGEAKNSSSCQCMGELTAASEVPPLCEVPEP